MSNSIQDILWREMQWRGVDGLNIFPKMRQREPLRFRAFRCQQCDAAFDELNIQILKNQTGNHLYCIDCFQGSPQEWIKSYTVYDLLHIYNMPSYIHLLFKSILWNKWSKIALTTNSKKSLHILVPYDIKIKYEDQVDLGNVSKICLSQF